MQLTMSMFATQADYWKARAELAEKTVEETAKELGCEPDNESMLKRAYDLVQHGKANIEYTDWFPPEIEPVRNGLYLLKHGRNADCWHMGYWNGKGWYGAESAIHGHCTEMDLLGGGFANNAYYWRGLTSEAN